MQAILDRLHEEDPEFRATLRRDLARDSLEIDRTLPIIEIVNAVAREKFGEPLPFSGMSGWTDCALMAAAGIPSFLLGPSGHGAHAAEEYVDLQSVEDLAAVLEETIVRFCGPWVDPA